jgi:hypothetical protein
MMMKLEDSCFDGRHIPGSFLFCFEPFTFSHTDSPSVVDLDQEDPFSQFSFLCGRDGDDYYGHEIERI